MVTLNPTPVWPSQPDNEGIQYSDSISNSNSSNLRSEATENTFDTVSTLGKALKLIHQLHTVPDCDDAYWSSAPMPIEVESDNEIAADKRQNHTEETGQHDENCSSSYLYRGSPIARLARIIGKWVQKLYSFGYDRIDGKP